MEAVHSGSFDTEKTSMDSALSLMTRTNRAIGWLKKNREGSPLAVAWVMSPSHCRIHGSLSTA